MGRIFLNSPRSTPSDRRSFCSNFLVPPKSHGQKQLLLASTPEILFFCESSPCFVASSRKTLETSLFYATRTTNLHINGNVEATQPKNHQRNDDRGERVIPPPAPKEPLYTRGAGASDRERLLAGSRSKNRTNEEGEGTSLHRREEGRRHPSRGRRRRYYERTPAGFLVKKTHQYGSPVSYDSGSDSD